jgi:hypothetical protein
MIKALATASLFLLFSTTLHLQPLVGPHAYFEEAVASPYHWRSWSLRDSAQIEAHLYRKNAVPRHTSYLWPNDPFPQAQDGAKIVLPPNVQNYEQMRFPIDIGAHKLGVKRVSALIVWEFWGDESWITELNPQPNRPTPRHGYKSFQLASYGKNPKIWFEPRHRFFGQGGNFSYLDVRSYGAPDASNGTVLGGPAVEFYDDALKAMRRYGSDALGPMLAEFPMATGAWTRFFVRVEFTAGDPYASVSLWVADETRDPVAILLDRRILNFEPGTMADPQGLLDSFWVEFNHSQGRTGGEMIGYVRNVIVLKDVPDVGRWLRRPVGTGGPGRAGASKLSAPRGLRVRH